LTHNYPKNRQHRQGGYSFIQLITFGGIMRKLGLAVLFMLAGCSADYSVELGNGYSYEHWGNNFIARTVAGEQRQVITGQVDSYLKKNALILAVQSDPAAPGKRYYVLDTGTDNLKQFITTADFLEAAKQLGFTDVELQALEK
jgi:hypothetical protein